MRQSILTIEAAYSTLSPSELLHEVVPQYRVPSSYGCKFWYRGLNDTYKILSKTKDFVLRVYRKDWRTRSDIEFELEALMYLHKKGASVAVPVERKDGGFITAILAPEGERYAIVTQYAEGTILTFDDARDALTFGQAAAAIHCCSSGFKPRVFRHRLDLNHLIEQPLANIKPYLSHRVSDWECLRALATRLARRVTSAGVDSLDYGFCHGDFHGENAHEQDGKVTHFDFDCCGFGWRSYDLATFKWTIRLLGKEHKLWDSFLDGYRSVREIADLDLSLVETFVGIRDIWYFGLNTGSSLAQGWLNDRYVDFHLDFLKGVGETIDSAKRVG